MNRDQAAQMMTALLVEHRLYAEGWRFNWMNRRQTYGLCRYGPKLVQLSTLFVDHNEQEKVLEVCLHEIAHALAGHKAAHGPEWRAIAIQLGVVNPGPCTDAAALPAARYQATCPTCSKLYSKTRPPKLTGQDGRFYYCPPCWQSPTLNGMKPEQRRVFAELKYADSFSANVPRTTVRQPVSASQSAQSVSLRQSDDRAPETLTELSSYTAPEVARVMGVDPKKFRAWLRKWEMSSHYQIGPGGSYRFSPSDVSAVVKAWNGTH